MNVNLSNIIGQVVDQTHTKTKAIIIKSKTYGQRLIIIKPISIIKSIPVFAILETVVSLNVFCAHSNVKYPERPQPSLTR
jgi:hypothetical protein